MMKSLLEMFLEAYDVQAATDVMDAISNKHKISWRAVGDRDNNLATINLGRDPAAGLIERITNAIDAVLEREWFEKGEPTNLRSPRQAVAIWYGIMDGRLENIDIDDPKVRDLADRITITLHNSGISDKPTVDIRDHGIGLEAKEFPNSIVGLNESRKLKKFFLAGAFGQGGSTALSYSNVYTLIVSRRCRRDSESASPIAATIVRFNPGDINTDKHGLYEYLCNRDTGLPFEFIVTEVDFAPGTLVRHIGMDLGKYHSIMTAPTASLWYLTHHYLFDPVLPFRIEEQRDNKSKGQKRFAVGNHRRLTAGPNTEYSLDATRDFRKGKVAITWWVLSTEAKEGSDPKNRITNYCLQSQPIIITYNGQKQGEIPSTVVKNDLKLPYLDSYLVVHVDCDKLDNESRRQLFPTTRESLRDTSLSADLKQLVIETLRGDPNLWRLDYDRKQRYMRKTDSQAVENLRRRLASRLSQLIRSGGAGHSPIVHPPSGEHMEHVRSVIPVQDPPTFLEITGRSPREAHKGKRFVLRFRTDAEGDYFRNPESFIAIVDPPSFGFYTGTTSVVDGYGTTYFKVAEDTEIGRQAEITLELRPRRAKTLKSSVNALVVTMPEQTGTSEGDAKTPNINPMWIGSGESFWTEHNWDENSVAKVVRSDSIDIYVSSENKKLNRLIAKAQRRDQEAVDSIMNFYLEHISFHAVAADIAEQKRSEQEKAALESTSESQIDQFQEEEMRRVCETVCGIMDQMFDVIPNHP